jgi:D-3-phosphoglycerate dehydrogenase
LPWADKVTTNIVIYYQILNYQPESLRLLQDHFQVITLPDPSHDSEDILNKANIVLAPLGHYFDREKIDKSPNLKVIGSNTTGHPHIDHAYAKKKGIQVITLKGEVEFLKTITPTAELTWGLIVALTRNMFLAYRAVLNTSWDRRPFGGRAMLSRMALGVAGYGRLGKMVASYGKCFEMNVRYYDPNVSHAESGITRARSLEELVSQSDIITIHITHEPATEKLFSRELFAHFKRGSYLINTSRGELVDEEALVDCLKNGILAGAAVDVLTGEFASGFENIIEANSLWQYAQENDNVIITPHIGGSTIDAWRLTEEYTIKRILQVLEH